MKKYKIIALFGKSGSGKDTLQKKIKEWYPQVNEMISTTTRPRRDYEINGKDYHFVDTTTFTKKVLNGDLLEATCFNDWFYGTDINQLNSSVLNIGVLNPQEIECLLEDPRLEVIPIYVQASDKTRLIRNLNREESPNCCEICRRFFTDEKDFDDISFSYKAIQNETTDDLFRMKALFESEGLID